MLSPRTKKQRKRKRRARGNRLFHGDAFLVGVAGFGLAYFVLVGHSFAHPVHWFYAGVGGLVGYLASLFWIYRPSWMRSESGRKLWFYRGGAGLFVALFILAFVLIGYVFSGGQSG